MPDRHVFSLPWQRCRHIIRGEQQMVVWIITASSSSSSSLYLLKNEEIILAGRHVHCWWHPTQDVISLPSFHMIKVDVEEDCRRFFRSSERMFPGPLEENLHGKTDGTPVFINRQWSWRASGPPPPPSTILSLSFLLIKLTPSSSDVLFPALVPPPSTFFLPSPNFVFTFKETTWASENNGLAVPVPLTPSITSGAFLTDHQAYATSGITTAVVICCWRAKSCYLAKRS